MIHHYLNEEWSSRALQEPGVMIVSDLLPMEDLDKKVAPHNGSFSKILGRYMRDSEIMDLPTALAKMTPRNVELLNARYDTTQVIATMRLVAVNKSGFVYK